MSTLEQIQENFIRRMYRMMEEHQQRYYNCKSPEDYKKEQQRFEEAMKEIERSYDEVVRTYEVPETQNQAS